MRDTEFSGPIISVLNEYDPDFLTVSIYFNSLMLKYHRGLERQILMSNSDSY